MDWTAIINDASTAVLSGGVLFGLLKKYPLIGKVALYAEQHAGEIVKGAEEIGKEILSTPAGALVAHELHNKLDEVSTQFQKSEVAKLALIGLHSFGVVSANLSDSQKIAIADYVGVDPKEVSAILQEAEAAVTEFGNRELVKAANIFTVAQKASAVVTAV